MSKTIPKFYNLRKKLCVDCENGVHRPSTHNEFGHCLKATDKEPLDFICKCKEGNARKKKAFETLE